MKIKRPWAFWRRVQYGAGLAVFLAACVGLLFLALYDNTTSCFDGLQNALETGVDCGGGCVRICSADVFPPKVLWAESFEIIDGQYNAVAYIENVNDVASTERLRYTFILENNGVVVAERSGESILPPKSKYPIFEGRISTNGHSVTDTTIRIEPVEIWQPATAGPEQFKVNNIVLSGADVRPRLDATLENAALQEARNIEVVTTLFNFAGQPLTASQTFVDVLPGRTAKDIVFTWPRSIATTIRSCSIPSDVVLGIDLSGSMNSDSENPPQPLTDAKQAAVSFVERLSAQDQIGVVTFATDAATPVTLTRDRSAAAARIMDFAITPEAEVGFTNTVAALEQINEELSSTRHNSDARRAAVLLTDGLPTSRTENQDVLIEQATAAARAIEQSGAELFIIGLGSNVDQTFIQNLSGKPSNTYLAPSGAELAGIYEQITSALCESGATRIDVIPKTKTNFTPLNESTAADAG